MTGWAFLGKGCTRIVFRRKNSVLKIPINADGIRDNLRESYIYRFRSSTMWSWGRFAPCRMIPGTHFLMMVFARCVIEGKTDKMGTVLASSLPGWASGIDCSQVGFTKRGKVVAYDYGR